MHIIILKYLPIIIYIDLQNVQHCSLENPVYCLMKHCAQTDIIEMHSRTIIINIIHCYTKSKTIINEKKKTTSLTIDYLFIHE